MSPAFCCNAANQDMMLERIRMETHLLQAIVLEIAYSAAWSTSAAAASASHTHQLLLQAEHVAMQGFDFCLESCLVCIESVTLCRVVSYARTQTKGELHTHTHHSVFELSLVQTPLW